MPIAGEDWQRNKFTNDLHSSLALLDEAHFEYTVEYIIENPNVLTIREYNKIISGVIHDFNVFWDSKGVEELMDEDVMIALGESEIVTIIDKWETDNIKLNITYTYSLPFEESYIQENDVYNSTDRVRRKPGTIEDYNSLFTIMPTGFQNQTVSEFDESILIWATNNEDSHRRIMLDVGHDDIRVNLTNEELSFVTLTYPLSNAENTAMVYAENHGGKQEVPVMQYTLTVGDSYDYWYTLWYQLSVDTKNIDTLTVGEQDQYFLNVINGMNNFWNGKTIEEISTMDEEDFSNYLATLVSQNSNKDISFEVLNLTFEGMNDQGI